MSLILSSHPFNIESSSRDHIVKPIRISFIVHNWSFLNLMSTENTVFLILNEKVNLISGLFLMSIERKGQR